MLIVESFVVAGARIKSKTNRKYRCNNSFKPDSVLVSVVSKKCAAKVTLGLVDMLLNIGSLLEGERQISRSGRQ